MLDAYIYNGLRTPFGRNAGVLAKVRSDDMLGGIIRAVVDSSSFEYCRAPDDGRRTLPIH